MDRYFKQYNDHVIIKGVHFVILHQYDLRFVRSFFRKLNTDRQYEVWERISPDGLISDEEDI